MRDYIGSYFIFGNKSCPISDIENIISGIEFPIYEVMRVEEGIPLFLEDHFKRLEHTFKLLKKELYFTEEFIQKLIWKLIETNEINSNPVKLLFFEDLTGPQILLFFMKAPVLSYNNYKQGIHTVLLHEERINPNAKVWNEEFRNHTISFLTQKNALEAVLVNPEGFITEGSRSNVFFVKDEIIYTSPPELVLPGITRKKVMAICRDLHLVVLEEKINYNKIDEFDTAFLTGTSRKVLPIKSINEKQFDVKNETMKRISEAFEDFTQEYTMANRN